MGGDVGELFQFRIRPGQLLRAPREVSFRPLALGDVDNGTQDPYAALGLDGIETDLHRELGAVLVQAVKVAADAHGTCVRIGEEAGAIGGVLAPKALRDQDLHGLSLQLFAAVAEDLLRLSVEQHDPALRVDHDHRVRSPFHGEAELLLGSLAIGNLGLQGRIGLRQGFGSFLNAEFQFHVGQMRCVVGAAQLFVRRVQLLVRPPQGFLGALTRADVAKDAGEVVGLAHLPASQSEL